MMTSPTGQKNKSRRRLSRNDSGFTLLELVLVMVIVCTLLSMAAPSLKGFFDNREMHDIASEILTLTKYARSQAIAEGKVFRLNFNLPERKYWLSSQEGSVFERLKDEFGRIFIIPDEINIEFKKNSSINLDTYIACFPTGRIEPAEIRLENIKGERIDIICPSPTEEYAIQYVEND